MSFNDTRKHPHLGWRGDCCLNHTQQKAGGPVKCLECSRQPSGHVSKWSSKCIGTHITWTTIRAGEAIRCCGGGWGGSFLETETLGQIWSLPRDDGIGAEPGAPEPEAIGNPGIPQSPFHLLGSSWPLLAPPSSPLRNARKTRMQSLHPGLPPRDARKARVQSFRKVRMQSLHPAPLPSPQGCQISFMLLLTPPGSSWLLMVLPGSSWLLLAPPGVRAVVQVQRAI